MVRPKIQRRISKKVNHKCFNHEGAELNIDQTPIKMNLDEFEAIRLSDFHNLKQKEAAELMNISQPTFHRILNSARKKTAKSLVEGISIEINNENFIIERNIYLCKYCGFQWNNPNKEYKFCPDCHSENIEIVKLDDVDSNNNSNNLKFKHNDSTKESLNNKISFANVANVNMECSVDKNQHPLNSRKSFGGLGSGRGPSKSCICPNCGFENPKIKGIPCKNMKCKKCGTPLCGLKK